ncbi:TnsA endonuclease N-terminal domain-containing protein [Pseudomonas putida]|uniref:TnsA endonuclease N-terminal domain-containing protein n=1 Tax=Pseudomonas putida TaxID=303 RepID=UPI0015FC7E88|nr:TnsA endonuclease N-terminal domain-containing protein [Pseudomonas putida]
MIKPSRRVSSRIMTDEKIEKRIKAGFGEGTREHYKPWIRVRDVPSKGSSYIVPGVKTGRPHHLLSKGEYYSFLIYENDPAVVDIREQFPLHPRNETSSIASSLGYSAPIQPGSSESLVFTTDLLLTKQDEHGNLKLEAKSIKYLSDLQKSQDTGNALAIFQRLDIERRYWAKRNVEYELVIAEDLSENLVKNILTMRSYATIPASLGDQDVYRKLIDTISSIDTSQVPLGTLLRLLARKLYLPYKNVKSITFHLLWKRELHFDHYNTLIDLHSPLSIEPSVRPMRNSGRMAK